MSKIYDSEIGKMQHLINYGMNENASKEGKPVVEYHTEGADGKTYGILRECNKFYIKVAPKKDTPILAEDYDYIGGYMNKKANEYTTYAVASKNFDLKMKQLAESVGSKKIIEEQYSKVKPAEWQINETKEMRAEIDRFNQIVSNSKLIEEGKDVKTPICYGEKCGIVGDDTYTEEAKADNGKDRKNETDKDHKPTGGNPFTICAKPDNGKKSSENEGVNRTVKLTEEQVLAWDRDNDNYMDKSHGTSVGSSSPFKDEVGEESNQTEADTDPIREGVAMHNADNQNTPTPGTSDRGDDDPFTNKVNEGEEIDPDDVAGMSDGFEIAIEPDEDDEDVEDVELYDDEEGFDDEEDDEVPFPEVASDDELADLDFDNWDKLDDDDDYDFDPFENRGRRGEALVEVVLDDFGKHPAYRKEPMTIPSHTMADKHGKDWNDETAKLNEPFGRKIGKSDPFDEDLVDSITDAVVDMITKKKD